MALYGTFQMAHTTILSHESHLLSLNECIYTGLIHFSGDQRLGGFQNQESTPAEGRFLRTSGHLHTNTFRFKTYNFGYVYALSSTLLRHFRTN